MAYGSITYQTTGTQTVFTFPFDYINKTYVKATLNEVALSYGVDYEVNGKEITFTTAPDGLLIINRETPTDRLVEWNEGSILLADDMTLSQLQQLHIMEEGVAWSKENTITTNEDGTYWEGRHLRFSNVADPINPQDAVTKNYLENVQGGYIQNVERIKKEAVDNTTQLKNDTLALKNQTIENEGRTKSYMEQAQQSAGNAEASETEATNQANLAKQYANNASASATASANSATASETSKTGATTQANLAKQYADEAKAQATASSNSATASATSASEAESSADSASASATNSANSATASATSASEAQVSAELAKQYAESADITDVANMQPITVTASKVADFTATFKTRSTYANSNNYTEYDHTLKTTKSTLNAGTYNIATILQQLINESHQHTYSNGKTTVSNCNCDCNCDCH